MEAIVLVAAWNVTIAHTRYEITDPTNHTDRPHQPCPPHQLTIPTILTDHTSRADHID